VQDASVDAPHGHGHHVVIAKAAGFLRGPHQAVVPHLPDKSLIMSDKSLDSLIEIAAEALKIPLDDTWKPAVRTNLQIILQHAERVGAFRLSDDAEPAPVFKA
jgi:hypothetical protein